MYLIEKETTKSFYFDENRIKQTFDTKMTQIQQKVTFVTNETPFSGKSHLIREQIKTKEGMTYKILKLTGSMNMDRIY